MKQANKVLLLLLGIFFYFSFGSAQSILGLPYGTSRADAEKYFKEKYDTNYVAGPTTAMIVKPEVGGVYFDYATISYNINAKGQSVLDGGVIFKEVPPYEIEDLRLHQEALLSLLREKYVGQISVSKDEDGDYFIKFGRIGKTKKKYGACFIDKNTHRDINALVLIYYGQLKTFSSDL